MASGSRHQINSSSWYEIVKQYYPKALSRTYTVPPVHFNRIPLTLETVPGTSLKALVHGSDVKSPSSSSTSKSSKSKSSTSKASTSTPTLQSPQVMFPEEPQGQPVNVQRNDLQDDAAQARIVRNLEELGRHRQEVMFILSQFDVKNYLSKPLYNVASSHLPRPFQLDRPGEKLSDREADVLIIHRHQGILIGEIKSVGHNFADLNLTEAQSDAAVVKRLEKSLEQLDRLEKVVRYVVSDVAPSLTVRTAVFLPNVTRAQLQRVLTTNQQLEQDICKRLGVTDATKAAELCCTEDDLSARDSWWDIPAAVMSKLTTWWNRRMDREDPAMSDQTYLDIVARFVGPASSVIVHSCASPRVEVRTKSEAVAQLGWRLSRLVLTPQQWDLMSWQPPLVFLTGPPGTGKTVVLVLLGVNWLQQGIDTYVVSARPGSLAISTLIFKQLEKTATSAASPKPIGNMRFCQFDFDNDSAALNRAVTDLTAAARNGARIIMDEVDFNTSNVWGQRTYALVQDLIRHVPGLHLWCAGIFHKYTPPSGLQVQELTTPLRSAPAILREVRPSLARFTGVVHNYTDSGIPAPGDGQHVEHLRHEGVAHTGRWPVNCEQCGRDVAAMLRDLRVGVPGSGLTFCDVLILTRSMDLQDEEKNKAGVVTSQASGFVRGLKGAGMPVCVLGYKVWKTSRARWEKEMVDLATSATNRITVADWGDVYGLERKVVVWLRERCQGDEEHNDESIDAMDRLYLVTRCTTHLMVVDVPP